LLNIAEVIQKSIIGIKYTRNYEDFNYLITIIMKSPGKLLVFFTILAAVLVFIFLAINKSNQPSFTDQTIFKLATDYGLDLTQFKADYKNQEIHDLVASQKDDGVKRMGNEASTPAIFVNTNRLNFSTFGDLKTKIDQLISDPSTKLPVLVEIFVDYKCPHCRDFEQNYYVALQQDIKYSGKVNFSTKNFPFLSDDSVNYAWGAEAAKKQAPDKFIKFSAELFNRAQGVSQ